MDGACFHAPRQRAATNADRRRDRSWCAADRNIFQHLDGEVAWHAEARPAAGADVASGHARGATNPCSASRAAGHFWSAESTGNFPWACRRGTHGRAEGFHRWVYRMVRADGEKRDSIGRLGGDQRSDRRSSGDRNVPHGLAGNGELDRLRPSDGTPRNVHEQFCD